MAQIAFRRILGVVLRNPDPWASSLPAWWSLENAAWTCVLQLSMGKMNHRLFFLQSSLSPFMPVFLFGKHELRGWGKRGPPLPRLDFWPQLQQMFRAHWTASYRWEPRAQQPGSCRANAQPGTAHLSPTPPVQVTMTDAGNICRELIRSLQPLRTASSTAPPARAF